MTTLYKPGFYTIKGMLWILKGDDIVKYKFPVSYSIYLPLRNDMNNTLNEDDYLTEEQLLGYGLTILNNILPSTLNNANIKSFIPYRQPLISITNDTSFMIVYFHNANESETQLKSEDQLVPYNKKLNSYYETYNLSIDNKNILANNVTKLVSY